MHARRQEGFPERQARRRRRSAGGALVAVCRARDNEVRDPAARGAEEAVLDCVKQRRRGGVGRVVELGHEREDDSGRAVDRLRPAQRVEHLLASLLRTPAATQTAVREATELRVRERRAEVDDDRLLHRDRRGGGPGGGGHVDRPRRRRLGRQGVRRDQERRDVRAVVREQLPGTVHRCCLGRVLGPRVADRDRNVVEAGAVERLDDVGGGDGPAAKNLEMLRRVHADDGRLDANGARARVQDREGLVARREVHRDVRGRRRRHVPERVGARGRDALAGSIDERTSDWMVRAAQADEARTAGDRRRNDVRRSGHERDRPGPQRAGDGSRGGAGVGVDFPQRVHQPQIGDVDNERVGRRPPLHLEDALGRRLVQRVSAEPIDGLGGHGNKKTLRQPLGGHLDVRLVGRQRRHGIFFGIPIRCVAMEQRSSRRFLSHAHQ
mmetsp:Transcript_2875/g.8932  ORF Transcript_2875/g.8932 Transcript_2875/m.8932 type:complete len:438 (+) Transcript_2875:143-1456(+)